MGEMFVSYCHAEMKLVDPVVKRLARNHNVWIDHLLQIGDLFDYKIEDSIDRCDAFLVFLSIYYVKSTYCLKEMRRAKEAGKTILPVALDDYNAILQACPNEEMHGYVEWIRHNLNILPLEKFKTTEELTDALSNSDMARQCERSCPAPIQFPEFQPRFEYTDEMTNRYTYNYRPDGKALLDMIGREKELQQLHEFIKADAGKKWWMVLGPGGSGKSRLCYQLACEMHREGWDVYYLTVNIEEHLGKMEKRLPNDRLVIIDYALSHNDAVSSYLKSLCGWKDNHFKLKVVLVDRDMAGNSNDSFSHENINAATRFLDIDPVYIKAIRYKEDYIDLNPLGKECLKAIISQYSSRVCRKGMDEGTAGELADRLARLDKKAERPLYAIFMADAWANGNSPLAWGKEEMLGYVYDRERAIWFKDAPLKDKEAYGKDEAGFFMNAVSELVSYATINGGIGLEKLEEACKESTCLIRDSLKRGMSLEKYLGDIGMLAIRDGIRMMAAFKPDIVGEYIVLSHMKKNLGMINGIFTEGWLGNAGKKEFISNMFMDHMGELKELDCFWDKMLYVDLARMAYRERIDFVFYIPEFAKTGNKRLNQKIMDALLKMRGTDERLDSVIYNKLGDISQSLGDHGQALEYYRKALEIRERLAKETGTVESIDDLAVSYYKMGSIVENEREKKEYYQKAANIWGDLRKKYPSVREFENRYNIVLDEMNAILKEKPKSRLQQWLSWLKK